MTVNQYLPTIVSSLKQGDLRVIYDSSFNDGYGTIIWCLDGGGCIVRGLNIVPIGSDTLDATRYKLAGIYTILRIIQCMVQYFKLDEAVIEVGSDCKSDIDCTLLTTYKIPFYYTNGSYLDLINAIK